MNNYSVPAEELERTVSQLKEVLSGYQIKFNQIEVIPGPSVSMFKVFLSPGEKLSTLRALADDIAASLNKKGVRIVTLRDSAGIEIENETGVCVELQDILEAPEFRESDARLPLALGRTFGGKVKVIDLADAPNILVAGATKQGKSVCLKAMAASLLYRRNPEDLKLILIDPKGIELKAYRELFGATGHDISVVTKTNDVADTLDALFDEVDKRYDSSEKHPNVVCFIEEFADLTVPYGNREAKALSKRIMTAIIRIAQKGRSVGIHLVISTQRPTVDVITGLIKANFPTRIAFRTSSRIDSMAILDMPGAERLIGNGDMLLAAGTEMERLQGAHVSSDKTERNVDASCEYENPPKNMEVDVRFKEAVALVVITQNASVSELQRKLGLGDVRANRIMNQLEAAGVVGPKEDGRPREVLVKTMRDLDEVLQRIENEG